MGNTDASGLYRFGSQLGKGSYGVVYKAERRSDDKVVAIKTVKVDSLTPALMTRTLDEVRLLASIQHPNIIGFESSFYDDKKKTLCIVTEYAAKGDLQHKIAEYRKHNRRIPESVVWKVLLHVSRGLKYLHQNRIIHRDMKAANVFESADGVYKIGDLNLSKILSGTMSAKTQLGTPLYLSPEIWQHQEYGTQSDMWSLGVLAFELTMLRNPFKANTVKELKNKIFTIRPSRVNHYSQVLADTIDKLLTVDPLKRPNADEIVELAEKITRTYYNEPKVQPEESQEIDLLKTIVLPSSKQRWNMALPKQRAQRKNQQFRSHSIDGGKLQSQNSVEDSECTREVISNISNVVPGGDDKRIGSAIEPCRKRKPNGGKVKLLPLPTDDKENIHPNRLVEPATETTRQP